MVTVPLWAHSDGSSSPISYLLWRKARSGEGVKANPALQQFGLAMQLTLIAVSLNLFTIHGILRSTTSFGVVWILMGCLNRITFEERRNMSVQEDTSKRTRVNVFAS